MIPLRGIAHTSSLERSIDLVGWGFLGFSKLEFGFLMADPGCQPNSYRIIYAEFVHTEKSVAFSFFFFVALGILEEGPVLQGPVIRPAGLVDWLLADWQAPSCLFLYFLLCHPTDPPQNRETIRLQANMTTKLAGKVPLLW